MSSILAGGAHLEELYRQLSSGVVTNHVVGMVLLERPTDREAHIPENHFYGTKFSSTEVKYDS